MDSDVRTARIAKGTAFAIVKVFAVFRTVHVAKSVNVSHLVLNTKCKCHKG